MASVAAGGGRRGRCRGARDCRRGRATRNGCAIGPCRITRATDGLQRFRSHALTVGGWEDADVHSRRGLRQDGADARAGLRQAPAERGTCATHARPGRWISDLQPRREPHRLHRCNAGFPVGLVAGTGAWRLTTTVSAKCLGPDMAQRRALVYSSIKSGTHMGLVASSPLRTEARDVYFPASAAGMAHRSAPSPAGDLLLVVEMDQGTWQPCRLVPVDGSSAGRPVGPLRGQCTSAGWSPNGRWMYLSSNAGGAYHIWRQRYPDGTPEQITVGPTEQEGTAITPDGLHLITSMGLQRAAIWLHDGSQDRQLTNEGYAMWPMLAPSGTRLFYLLRTQGSQGQASGELWSMDLSTPSRQQLFPGLVMANYSLSLDGLRVVFTSSGHEGGDGVWIADIDRRTPPRQLTRNSEQRAFFGAPGEIVFMGTDGRLYRTDDRGSAPQLISPEPVVYLMTVSPDGRWAAVITRARGMVAARALSSAPCVGSGRLPCATSSAAWDRGASWRACHSPGASTADSCM